MNFILCFFSLHLSWLNFTPLDIMDALWDALWYFFGPIIKIAVAILIIIVIVVFVQDINARKKREEEEKEKEFRERQKLQRYKENIPHKYSHLTVLEKKDLYKSLLSSVNRQVEGKKTRRQSNSVSDILGESVMTEWSIKAIYDVDVTAEYLKYDVEYLERYKNG